MAFPWELIEELFLIVEYCDRGNLLSYIRRHKDSFVDQLVLDAVDSSIRDVTYRASKPAEGTSRESCSDSSSHDHRGPEVTPTGEVQSTVTTTDLLCWAFQIARGMEYLASRKVIHGDLATRNVLLTDSSNVVKLCDFGLAKEMYRDYNYIMSTKSGKFPIKWMAIESIYYGELSAESDCWSFGVVLWELFSLGKIPYSGIKADEGLIKRIDSGYRLEKPEYASSSIYKMMLECWAPEKENRPTFSELANRIGYMMGEMLRDHYVELNAKYALENPETGLSSQESEDSSSTGAIVARILSRNKQDMDTCGYLRPIQLPKPDATSTQGPSHDQQHPVVVPQHQHHREQRVAAERKNEPGNNLYVTDPTFSLPRSNSTGNATLV